MNQKSDHLKETGITGIPNAGSLDYDSKQVDWQGSSTEGFYYKPLVRDQHMGISTLLMKVDPGAFSPLHAHDDIEQIYIMEGSIYDQDKTYNQGEFIIRSPGTMHTTGSENGAVVLLFFSPVSDI